MRSFPARYARSHLTDLLNLPHRCLITIHSHPTKALVSPKDLQILEFLDDSDYLAILEEKISRPQTPPIPPVTPTSTP